MNLTSTRPYHTLKRVFFYLCRRSLCLERIYFCLNHPASRNYLPGESTHLILYLPHFIQTFVFIAQTQKTTYKATHILAIRFRSPHQSFLLGYKIRIIRVGTDELIYFFFFDSCFLFLLIIKSFFF